MYIIFLGDLSSTYAYTSCFSTTTFDAALITSKCAKRASGVKIDPSSRGVWIINSLVDPAPRPNFDSTYSNSSCKRPPSETKKKRKKYIQCCAYKKGEEKMIFMGPSHGIPEIKDKNAEQRRKKYVIKLYKTDRLAPIVLCCEIQDLFEFVSK